MSQCQLKKISLHNVFADTQSSDLFFVCLGLLFCLIHYHGTDSIKGCKALCFAIIFPVDFAFQINHKFPASELYLNKIPVSSSLAIDKKSYDFPCLNCGHM